MRTTVLLVVVVVAAAVIAPLLLGHGDPARQATILRRLGFGLIAVETGFFGLFVVAETVADPGGGRAVGLIAAWLVPLVVLVLLAWRRPDWATWVLGVVTAVLVAGAVWFAVDPQGWRSVEMHVGPVRAIAAFVVAAALGVLGLRRTTAAGVLLLVAGAVPLLMAGINRGVSPRSPWPPCRPCSPAACTWARRSPPGTPGSAPAPPVPPLRRTPSAESARLGSGRHRARRIGRPLRPRPRPQRRLHPGHGERRDLVGRGDARPAVDADRGPGTRTEGAEPGGELGRGPEGAVGREVLGRRGTHRPGDVPGPGIHRLDLAAVALPRPRVQQDPAGLRQGGRLVQ
jgi:hypothetical protein